MQLDDRHAAAPTDRTRPWTAAATPRVVGSRTTVSVLLIEDSAGDARLLREMLRMRDSYEADLVHISTMGGAERHLADRDVDIILLDLGLPDAQGMEGVRRAHEAAPGVPLVVLTGLDDEALGVQALQEGAQDYLVKGQIEAPGLLRAMHYAIERKAAEDARLASEHQLLQAQKLESIGRLAGGIAHDFNNLLFEISGYAELLALELVSTDQDHVDPPRLLPIVTAISDSVGRATALTGQLLAFSRQQAVAVQILDVNATVLAVAPMTRQLIGERLRLVLELDPFAGHIRADAGQIEQIVVNLIVNARDAMPDGGTVVIETGRSSPDAAHPIGREADTTSYVHLEVRDDGVGMDQATRQHMFEPYFSTNEVGKGTGLGLATAHGIVEQAGGYIEVRSEPGRGSAFKLYFPSVDPPPEEPSTVPSARTLNVGKVLVVEDDPAVRAVVSRLLEREGYDVTAAADGEEALRATRLGPPIDVLITDVVMPDMSGLELADSMSALDPSIAVVFLSAYTPDGPDLDRAFARGATFVPKPVSANGLTRAVRAAIEASRVNTSTP